VLIASELLTEEERALAIAEVPWRDDVLQLAGLLFGALRNQSIDLIDTAIGPSHVRAALVALHEAADLLLEGSIDLAESVACEQYFQRVKPVDPLRGGLLEDADSVARFPWRLARYAVEEACTHVITAGDHLANTHVRLAWEINAATEAEMKKCSFDPAKAEPRSWITASDLQSGLRAADAKPLGVFKAFEMNDGFYSFMDASAKAREYRHAIIHRDRPTYRELPAFGRTTLWTQDRVTVNFPPQPNDKAPPLSTYRAVTAEALASGVTYAFALWDLAVRWLPTVRVQIRTLPKNQIEIKTDQGGFALPRDQRDPGAFVLIH
jgi:hypothetical protein